MQRAVSERSVVEGCRKKPGFKALSVFGVCLVLSVAAIGGIFHRSGTPVTYNELATLSVKRLALHDVALVNLLCADGLPGADGLDIRSTLDMLDRWAQLAQANEEKYASEFACNPGRYDHSRAKFKAVQLGFTLKQDLGCGYNHELAASGAMADVKSTRFFTDSRDLFLHGMVSGRRGSCSSLPVLFVAVGRRCGYPLHLVSCKGHLFCRWENGKERFNIEVSCPGIDSPSDEHYRKWPYPFTDAEMRTEKYLKTLDAQEMLGVFSDIRASCLDENGRFNEAAAAYAVSMKAFPESRQIQAKWAEAVRRSSIRGKETVACK